MILILKRVFVIRAGNGGGNSGYVCKDLTHDTVEQVVLCNVDKVTPFFFRSISLV
jgi:hypothetical protein